MIPQAKLLRVFKLIRLLNQQPGRTISQLAESVDLSERSVYRYIQFLETVGYSIDSDPRTGRFFLFGPGRDQPDAFTEEEADLVRQSLAGVAGSNQLLAGIRQKLFLSSTLVPLADGLADIHQSRLIGQLVAAIQQRVQVRLLHYHSANSGTISDRLVEPLAFTDDYATLDAFEPATETIKTFKTKRIGAVELTETPASRLSSDTVLDLFGWTGPGWLSVEMRLANRAYRLLIEEFPAAAPDIEPSTSHDDPFAFTWRGRVRDWRGIGRFVLGLPGEVRIVAPDDFRVYLRSRTAESTF